MTKKPWQAHFQTLSRCLDMEIAAEERQWRAQHKKRTNDQILRNLRFRGEEITPGNVALLEFSPPGKHDFPNHRLIPGVPVAVLAEQSQTQKGDKKTDKKGRANNDDNGRIVRGLVAVAESRKIVVAVSDFKSVLAHDDKYTLERVPDSAGVERQKKALKKFTDSKFPRDQELLKVFFGLREPEFGKAEDIKWKNTDLSKSQKAAVVHALSARDMAIIHGPPGTGKTTAVIELIQQCVSRNMKVLACAPSHVAVDNILARLLDCEERPVTLRIGHPARTHEALRSRCLDVLAKNHENAKLIAQLYKDSRNMFRQASKWTRARRSGSERREQREIAKMYRNEARKLEVNVLKHILDRSQVVCATLTGLNDSILHDTRFDIAIIDEACQTTEPACWIAMARSHRVVFAGDHCQLPPTIIAEESLKLNFDHSLPERLLDLHGAEISSMLKTQYRMNTSIMQFSSDQFYDSQLIAHESVADHRLCDLTNVSDSTLTAASVRYIDTAGSEPGEERDAKSRSYFNRNEIEITAKLLGRLFDDGLLPSQCAVISPYSAQADKLRDRLAQVFKEREFNSEEPSDSISIRDLEIDTVDSFQGREKEAIVISLVRSNHEGKIGFLKDQRRFNVAMTRARRLCLIVGDSATLASDPFFQELLSYLETDCEYSTVWEDEALLNAN